MLLYACTIFLSAFLLFEVQPLIGKIILPWFGGSAAVWSACLLFFQASLLAGYCYAHFSSRYLKPRLQAALHVVLLVGSLALLPIVPSPAWKPSQAGDPSLRILLLLAATIGLQYTLLAATSPLLQAWCAAVKPGAIPYRLFALSNLASFLALFSYPLLVEPMLPTHGQALGWSAMYVGFVLLCSAVAIRSSRRRDTHLKELWSIAPGWKSHVLWIALAACASALLLAVTNHLTQNVAPIPFLWVAPLATYLLTFILCFERDAIYQRGIFLPLFVVGASAAAFGVSFQEGNVGLIWNLPIFLGALFVCCMLCHGELARLKPHPRYLTNFYLMVALGGALGGLFVAIGAPHIFRSFLELPVALTGCAVLAGIILWNSAGGNKPGAVAMGLFAAALVGYMGYEDRLTEERYVMTSRNFYGVLRVYESSGSDSETPIRELVYGAINHGAQILDPGERRTPTTYYGLDSGYGRAIRYFQQHPPLRVGVIGLGAGVSACYGRARDTFRFYEINPLALEIASTKFTFLKDCPADWKVLLGDARLTLEGQPNQNFDVLSVDAFTGDAIPMHLLTREAFELYFRHLQANGILAVHISNRYVDLLPVVAQNAAVLGKTAILVSDAGDAEDYLTESDWVLAAGNPAIFSDHYFQGSSISPVTSDQRIKPWRDDYSNLFQILK